MTPAWTLVENHIEKNWEIYTAGFSALCIAAICTMPEFIPKSWQDVWTWIRNTLQTAVPAARARQEAHSQTVVTTPTTSTKQEASSANAVDLPPNTTVADSSTIQTGPTPPNPQPK